MQIEEGAIVSGKVTGLTDFGAFVELEGGKTGMIHISEVAPNYVKDIKEHLIGLGIACAIAVAGRGAVGKLGRDLGIKAGNKCIVSVGVKEGIKLNTAGACIGA